MVVLQASAECGVSRWAPCLARLPAGCKSSLSTQVDGSAKVATIRSCSRCWTSLAAPPPSVFMTSRVSANHRPQGEPPRTTSVEASCRTISSRPQRSNSAGSFSARTPDRSRAKSTSHRSATRGGRPDNPDARDRLTQVCPSLRPRRSASHLDVGTAPFALSLSPGGRRGETTTGASTQRQTSQDLGVQAGPRGCCVAPPQGSADPTVRGSRRRRRWPPRGRKGRPAEPARPPSTRGPHRPQDNASRGEPCPGAVVIAGRRSARGAPAERPRQPRDAQQRGDTRYYVAPAACWRADQLQPRALPVASP